MAIITELETLVSKLEKELYEISLIDNKLDLRTLGYGVNIDLDDKELVKHIQQKHGLKIQSGKVFYWSNAYKKETVNASYILILSDVINSVQLLCAQLRQKSTLETEKGLKKTLKNKLRTYEKLVGSTEGIMFMDNTFRNQKNNLLKDRFDVIWNINEQYMLFPQTKKDVKAQFMTCADYPFIAFDLTQWFNFELAYRLIPILQIAVFSTTLGLKKSEFTNNTNIDELEKPIEPYIKTCPFKEKYGIFKNNGHDIFYTILLKSGIISVDKSNKITKQKEFRGACNHLYKILQNPPYTGILNSITKREFIDFLNSKNGYDAEIKKPEKSVIASEQSTYIASQKLTEAINLSIPKKA